MNLRELVKSELSRQGMSAYKLGNMVQATLGADGKPIANRETIFRYLRSDRDTSGDVLGVILDLLGLKLTTTAIVAPRREKKRRRTLEIR